MFGTEASLPILISLIIQVLLVPFQIIIYLSRKRDLTRRRFLILLVSFALVNSFFLANDIFDLALMDGGRMFFPFVIILLPIIYVRHYIAAELGVFLNLKNSIGLFLCLIAVVFMNDLTTNMLSAKFGELLWLYIIPFEFFLIAFNLKFFKNILILKKANSPIYFASIISLLCILLLPPLIVSFDLFWIESLTFNFVFFSLCYAYFVQYYSSAKSETAFLLAHNKLNTENLADGHLKSSLTPVADVNLTPREEEVALQLINGFGYQEICKDLFMTESGVRKHASNIFKKVGVSNLIEFKEKYSAK